MKRLLIPVSVILIALFLVSCGANRADVWAEATGKKFSALTVCKYGKIVSAASGEVCSIKINDNKYADFASYVEDLKADGFEYYQIGDVPENYELRDGQTSWRGSKGKTFVQLIFCEDGTENAEILGCNLQIFAYKTDPWAQSKSK